MEYTNLSDKILEYIANRAKPKLEAHDKKAEKERKKLDDPEKLPELDEQLAEEKNEILEKYRSKNWLTDAARRAKQIQFVTHPVKYTNPLIKGGSSCFSLTGSSSPQFMVKDEILNTLSLRTMEIDFDGNAAVFDVAGLLQLEQDGKTVADYIKNQDSTPLQPLAEDNEQLNGWMEGFGKVFTGENLSSHKYAKQIYYPIGEGKYHLLSPLFPSSLVHAIYERIAESRFSDTAKEVRKAKRELRFNESLLTDYPGTAIVSYGGTKPQNVSLLNNRRNGRVFLLPCGPPDWKTQDRLPLHVKSVFTRYNFGQRVSQYVWALKNHFERNLNRSSNLTVRNRRVELLDLILDQLIQYGAEIQSLTDHAGWTALPECKLSLAEKLWLDPLRDDDTFILEREKNDWQEGVADAFGFWLNKRLTSKKYTLGDVEHNEWKGQFEEKLNLLKEDLEVFA